MLLLCSTYLLLEGKGSAVTLLNIQIHRHIKAPFNWQIEQLIIGCWSLLWQRMNEKSKTQANMIYVEVINS